MQVISALLKYYLKYLLLLLELLLYMNLARQAWNYNNVSLTKKKFTSPRQSTKSILDFRAFRVVPCRRSSSFVLR